MRQELNSALGVYSPTFLKMLVSTNSSLKNLNVLSDHESAIYLHEYIHFLQDISTTFGYMNISTIVDYIKHVNLNAINDGVSDFQVPFQPQQNGSDFTYYNLQLRTVYLGSSSNISKVDQIIDVLKQDKPIPFPNGNTKNVPEIIIKYKYNETEGEYKLGSQCISEGMAYGIEQYIYPNLLQSAPVFPYQTASMVADKILPGFSNDPLNVVALCDASLLSFHPGVFYYDSLQEMVKENFYPQKPEDIYDFVTRIKFNYQNYTTLQQLMIGMGMQASQQLSGYFTTPIFGNNSTWITNLFTRALDLRIRLPHFIIDIARMGKIQGNICFSSVMNILGTPMTVNQDGEGTFQSPLINHNVSVHPEYLWAINQIFKTYVNPISRFPHCELKLWCQQSCMDQGIADYTDDRCFDHPWERVNDKELCVYAQVWKTWGLENEKPK